MKNKLIILLLGFLTFESYSQNDTLQLFDNCILFRGREYNKLINGLKHGKWIDYYIIDDNESVFSCASGVNLNNGKDVHWYIFSENVYRPLKPLEKEGEQIVLSSVVDSTFGDITYEISELIIFSKMPSELFYITSRGNYRNDLKTGKWIFYYKSGTVRKEIDYLNGLPTTGFDVFRENGKLMIEIIRLNDSDWFICKYSETGEILECGIKKIDEFRSLY